MGAGDRRQSDRGFRARPRGGEGHDEAALCRIIGITSIVGVTGNPGQGNYAASKAGMIGMTKSLAIEVASRGITANCIAPGFIETAMKGRNSMTSKRKRSSARFPAGGSASHRRSPLQRSISPVAEAGYVTGCRPCTSMAAWR